MAIDLSRPQADVSLYVHDATGVSQQHQLDFLDFVGSDGTIMSSAEWPARFGYKMEWLNQTPDWVSVGAFLTRMDSDAGPSLALLAVSTVRVGEKTLYVVGGERLGKEFLASLVLPSGMRALLYRNLDANFTPMDLIDAAGPASDADRFSPVIAEEKQGPSERSTEIYWTRDPASAEMFHVMPLWGRQKALLGLLLVGSSERDVVELERRILLIAFAVAAIGVLLGSLTSWWAAARITLPVQKLAAGAQAVAQGNWSTHVEIHSRDEIGKLAGAFNQMTDRLADQRDRLVQSERVAAWRELARRLAHELKNPLFPMQITLENLRRARSEHPEQFDEVFQESTSMLLSELDNLKSIVARFSDFARMPAPILQRVNLNEIVRSVVRVFESQFSAVGRPQITPDLHLDDSLPPIQADPLLIHKVVENLVLNAMDAMPAGGTISVGTSRYQNAVRLEVTDTGAGLTPEEAKHLFTPYYTTKQHGTGLGLAIVQSVVSDHHGTIGVESEPGAGTTIRVDLPIAPASTLQLDSIGKLSALSPVAPLSGTPSELDPATLGELADDGSAVATDHAEPDEKMTALSPMLPRSLSASEHESEILDPVPPEESLPDADKHPGLPQGLGTPTVEPPDSREREED
jgi:signal transduction histidine kinase